MADKLITKVEYNGGLINSRFSFAEDSLVITKIAKIF